MTEQRFETLPQLLATLAAEPDRERIFLEDEHGELSFGALVELAESAARACIACGLKPGERAALWAPNCREWIIAALGIQLAGGILVPLNTRFKGDEVEWIIDHSGAVMLFMVGDFLATDYTRMLEGRPLPSLKKRILFGTEEREGYLGWDQFMQLAAETTEEELQRVMASVEPDSIADMMFTSGTTGNPKGVLCTYRQNLEVFRVWGRTVGVHSSDNYLIINPFFHSFGYKAGWLAALIHRCRIVPLARFDVADVCAVIADKKISLLPGPPTIFQSLLAFPQRADYALGSLRLAVTGAASVPVELVRRMVDELGFSSVMTAYGLTESCGVVTICHRDDDPETVATTSGQALPGIELRCIDSEGSDVPRGEQGELLVRGYNVMKGYFDAPEETASTIDPEGWLHTGDVAVIDERGYVRITDRLKDMFICGGFNCYPAEIENRLSTLPGVASCALIGIPDERLGEVAAAFIVRDPQQDCGDEAAVIEACRERMANYKVPRRVFFVDALPLNAAGKVLKNRLRKLCTEQLSATA